MFKIEATDILLLFTKLNFVKHKAISIRIKLIVLADYYGYEHLIDFVLQES